MWFALSAPCSQQRVQLARMVVTGAFLSDVAVVAHRGGCSSRCFRFHSGQPGGLMAFFFAMMSAEYFFK